MGLSIYENAAYPTGDEVSKGGTFTQPVEVTLAAGVTSSGIELFLSTPDTQYYYTGITVTPVDVDSPSEAAWISLSDDGVTYGAGGAALTGLGPVGPGEGISVPFFTKLAVPGGEDAQIKTDLRFRLNYTKHAVMS